MKKIVGYEEYLKLLDGGFLNSRLGEFEWETKELLEDGELTAVLDDNGCVALFWKTPFHPYGWIAGLGVSAGGVFNRTRSAVLRKIIKF